MKNWEYWYLCFIKNKVFFQHQGHINLGKKNKTGRAQEKKGQLIIIIISNQHMNFLFL